MVQMGLIGDTLPIAEKRYNDPGVTILDSYVDLLRRRWPLLLSTFIFLLISMPSPAPRILVEEVHQAETAARAGRIEAALGHLESLIQRQPQLHELKLTAARLALQIGLPMRAQEYLQQIPPRERDAPVAACLADRASLQLLQEPVHGWSGLLDRCPEALEEVERFADLLAGGSAVEQLDAVLAALRSAGLDQGIWYENEIFLEAATNPEGSLNALRDLVRSGGQRAGLALSILDVVQQGANSEQPAYMYAQIGQAFARAGEWRFAALAFQHAIRLDPEYIEARAYYGLSLEQIGLDGLQELKQATQAAPTAALPHVFLAEHYRVAGDLLRAIREQQIAANLEPNNPAIAAELGALHAANGDLEWAEAAYRRAVERAPDDPRFWLLLAQFSLAYEVRIPELAIPAARNAITLSDRTPAALDALGYAHLLEGDLLLAERLLLRSLQGQPGRAQTQYHLGLLRIHQGDAQAGLAAFKTAEELDPQSPAGELARRGIETLLR